MPFFQRLYNTVWLSFFACVFIPRWMGGKVGAVTHVVFGCLLLVLTAGNRKRLAALPVPARLQRISQATAGLAVFQLVCGLVLGAVTHLAPTLPYVGAILRGVHVVCALAILAQASSTATGYDMWEEKEIGGPAKSEAQ